MTMVASQSANLPDSPDARRYNRIKRWLGIADFILGLAMLVVLLATGWTGVLRDLAYNLGFQNYVFSLFLYLLILTLLGKILGFGLDVYSFRLEHRYHLSNQNLRSWFWDETKGWLVGLVIG